MASYVLSEIIKGYPGGVIYWLTTEENNISISLCKKFGFSETGETYSYWLGSFHLVKTD